jgi:sulfatase modifying factor 1
MVFVPGGEYLRGRSYEWEDYNLSYYPRPALDDRPVKLIHVDPFYMDQTEVTNERYAAFIKARRHRAPYHWVKGQVAPGKEKHPVTNVSWDDAVAYCAWEGKRLPTEAEWERAARGIGEALKFPWGDRNPTNKDAHYGGDATVEVCTKEKNYFGLCDIIGNVWEWCSDWYGRLYYEEAPSRNPKGPDQGMYRVLRGGSYFDQPPLFLTTAYRSWARPAERSPTIGIRCVKSFPSRAR